MIYPLRKMVWYKKRNWEKAVRTKDTYGSVTYEVQKKEKE